MDPKIPILDVLEALAPKPPPPPAPDDEPLSLPDYLQQQALLRGFFARREGGGA